MQKQRFSINVKISIIYALHAALISSSIHTFTNSTNTHKYQRYTNMRRPCLDFPLWKLQYFGHLMRTADSLEKTLMWQRLKVEEEGDRGWDSWMTSLIQWTWTWANSGRWWGTERLDMLQSMGSQRVGHDLATEQQQQAAYIFCLDTDRLGSLEGKLRNQTVWVRILTRALKSSKTLQFSVFPFHHLENAYKKCTS